MKRFSLIAVVLLIAGLTLSAQQKGQMTISGRIGVQTSGKNETITGNNTTTSTSEKGRTYFNIGASYGIFILNNLEVGLGIDYGMNKWQRNQNSDSNIKLYETESNFTLTPQVRYYIPIVEGKFYYNPGLLLGFGFGGGNIQTSENTTVKDDPTFIFNMKLQLASFEFKPCDKLGISFSLGGLSYYMESSKNVTETVTKKDTYSSFDLSLDSLLYPELGFKWYFL